MRSDRTAHDPCQCLTPLLRGENECGEMKVCGRVCASNDCMCSDYYTVFLAVHKCQGIMTHRQTGL